MQIEQLMLPTQGEDCSYSREAPDAAVVSADKDVISSLTETQGPRNNSKQVLTRMYKP